jgi:Fe-Mn family superoxide dismutase
MAFELPQLSYAYDALEPHIDARTMEIHHSKHHQGYTNNLNAAIAGTEMEGKSIEALCAEHSDVPCSAQQRRGIFQPLHVLGSDGS